MNTTTDVSNTSTANTDSLSVFKQYNGGIKSVGNNHEIYFMGILL
jgi:hypothetical protein